MVHLLWTERGTIVALVTTSRERLLAHDWCGKPAATRRGGEPTYQVGTQVGTARPNLANLTNLARSTMRIWLNATARNGP